MQGDISLVAPNTVKLAGNAYVLERGSNGRALFSSGQRTIQGVESDDFRQMIFPTNNRGFLRSSHDIRNLVDVLGVLLPPPARTVLALTSPTGLFTRPLRDAFEEQDSNGRWYKYFWGPQAIVKVDITSSPPVVRQCLNLTQISAFAAADRLGQPIKLNSGGTNYWYLPCNNGDRIVKLTTPVGVETTDAAYSPVVTLNGTITAGASSLVYTSTGDPIAAGDILKIDSEEIRVGAVDAGTNTCSSLTRAWAGTTAAQHVDTTAITKKGGLDVYTAFTTAVKGAAHFEPDATARTYRANSSHSSGTAQNRAEISLLAAGAAPETDANWGDDFPVDNPTRWITALLSYGDLVLIHKQDGWFYARQLSDNTLKFDRFLPDDNLVEVAALGSESTLRGTTWHGAAFLPSLGGLWRSRTSIARLIDPGSISETETTDWNYGEIPPRYGRIPTVAGLGSWLYAIYPMLPVNDMYLIAGRENDEGTLDWFAIYEDDGINYLHAQCVSIQVNGSGAPQVFYVRSNTICCFPIGPDGNPAAIDTVISWDSQIAGSWVSKTLQFPCSVLLREMEYIIEDKRGVNTDYQWGLTVYRDDTAGEVVLAASSGRTSSGSIFWTPQTTNTCRRLRVAITTDGGSINNAYYPPNLRQAILHGTYLPDVSDEMQLVVNLAETARLQGKSQDAVYDALKALTSTEVAWVDLYGNTGYVVVRGTNEGGPPQMASLMGRPIVTVHAALQEYS